MGVAIIEALHAAGLASCGKHFPGHGDTLADSHHDLPVVEHEPARLRAVEFAPFRAAIRANVPAIMTAHVLVPAVDETQPGDALAGGRAGAAARRAWLRRRGVHRRHGDEGGRRPDARAGRRRAGARGRLRRRARVQREPRPAVRDARSDRARRGTGGAAVFARRGGAGAAAARERALSHGPWHAAAATAPTGCWPRSLGAEEHQAVADEMARFA